MTDDTECKHSVHTCLPVLQLVIKRIKWAINMWK